MISNLIKLYKLGAIALPVLRTRKRGTRRSLSYRWWRQDLNPGFRLEVHVLQQHAFFFSGAVQTPPRAGPASSLGPGARLCLSPLRGRGCIFCLLVPGQRKEISCILWLDQCFFNQEALPSPLTHPGDAQQCLETFLLVATGGMRLASYKAQESTPPSKK